MDKATNHEVVSIYRHSDEQIDMLLTKAPECVLMWGTKDHWPVGVVHSFVWHEGHVWVTFAAHRHRAAAIRRDPRVSVTVSGRTSDDPTCPLGAVTLKGIGEYQQDEDVKQWFYRALAKKVSPTDKAGEDDFYSILDSPLREVLKIKPEKWISFDADKSHRHRIGELREDEMSELQSSDAQRLQRERAKRGIDS